MCERKVWLVNTFDPHVFVDPKIKEISYSDFINKEFIQFSYANLFRALPCIVDGLKPCERNYVAACRSFIKRSG